MPSLAALTRHPIIKPLGAALLALALAGCAQQKTPGYYAVQQDTTAADAQKAAQGGSGARAPSQIQLGFGDKQGPRAIGSQAATPADETVVKARPLIEAKTFLGTVPCLNGETGCAATRITLTLAPSGEWRSRNVFLNDQTPGGQIVQQGCWDVIGTQPLRIVLMLNNQASMANLTFVNDNVLRINMINDIRPKLEYHLTRQADIDPIEEITDKTPLQCD